MPLFTRRIGVSGEEEDLEQIPITFGGKVNGRVGNTNVGALAVRTGAVDSLLAAATMGAVRIKQNVLEESSVGVLATFGDQLGNADSWMAGADFTFRTSNFGDEKNLLVGVWGLANNRADLQGDKVAYGGRIEYPNDLWDVSVAYTRIGDAFQPSLGFVPRTGRIFSFGGDFKPRPEWPLVRQMIYELSLFLVTDLDNEWESYLWTVKPLDWQLESGDRVEYSILAKVSGGRFVLSPTASSSSRDVSVDPAPCRRRARRETQDQRRVRLFVRRFLPGHAEHHRVETGREAVVLVCVRVERGAEHRQAAGREFHDRVVRQSARVQVLPRLPGEQLPAIRQ
jgi:hypothetical protein